MGGATSSDVRAYVSQAAMCFELPGPLTDMHVRLPGVPLPRRLVLVRNGIVQYISCTCVRVPARYRGDGGNACRGGTVLVWWLLWRSLAVLGDTTPGPGTDCSQGVLLPTISFALICVPSS